MDMLAWLEGLVAPGQPGADPAATPTEDDGVPTELLDELRADLEATAVWATRTVPADRLPLRLPKARLAALSRCERLAVASAESPYVDPEVTEPLFRGLALDRLVVHQLVAGRVLDPAAELRGALVAEGEWAALDHLDSLDDGEVQAVLWPLVGAVTDAWSGIGPEWVPRTQSPAMLSLADGAVVCSGLLDVELGGPVADRPGVVVEVKSGRPSAAHADEVYLYALLVALRDAAAPVEVARWYPGGGPVAVPVTAGMLATAARRLGDGIEQWAELQSGRVPEERPGGWCRYCPAVAECPSARPEGPVDPDDDLALVWAVGEEGSDDDD